jgi:hypothetical protein
MAQYLATSETTKIFLLAGYMSSFKTKKSRYIPLKKRGTLIGIEKGNLSRPGFEEQQQQICFI